MSDGGSEYFNVIPLFILFREAIEASIVVAVLLTFLNRASPKLKKQVWWGVGCGISIALVLAGAFAACFYVAQNNVFSGSNLLIFKGSVSWVASVIITYLAFAMLRYEGWEAKWERKLAARGVQKIVEEDLKAQAGAEAEGVEEGLGSQSFQKNPLSTDSPLPQPLASVELKESDDSPLPLDARPNPSDLDLPPPPPKGVMGRFHHTRRAIGDFLAKYTLFWVSFFTVLREGLEAVIFLFGVGNANPVSIPISGLIGIMCGVGVGFAIYYTGRSVKDIKWLLWTFATILFFIAAGAMSNGADSFMESGMFGPYVLPPTLYTYPGVSAISSTLFGGEGQPPVPSANGGAASPSAYTDADDIVVAGPVNLNDGYVYVLTPVQPWWQQALWDISACCSDSDDTTNSGRFFSLIQPIFGYNSQPAFIDVIFYLGYWFVTLSIGLWKYYKGRLTDADWKHTAMLKAQAEQEAVEAALAAKTADTWADPLPSPVEVSIQLAVPTKGGAGGGAKEVGSERGTSSDEHGVASSSEARESEERASPSGEAGGKV